MGDYSALKEEITQLVKDGQKLYEALEVQTGKSRGSNDLNYFLVHYEQWYTKSQAIVKQLTPDRLADFNLLYSNPKRKQLDVGNYCISDALRTISHATDRYGPWTASLCVLRQVMMLRACISKFDSKVFDIQTILQADIFDSEIESAKHLHKNGFIRAAGAICGVVLEKHFSAVCANRNITFKKKNPTIADYNDALKDTAYDTIEWRRIQRLGDIRNLCDHSKDREPTKDEVEELISGTERTIKTVF